MVKVRLLRILDFFGLKTIFYKILSVYGYRITRKFADYEYTRMVIYKSLKIDTILDIGANIGQYANIMRELGYDGHILSFEPMKKEYDLLLQNSENDKNWNVFNYGFGDKNEQLSINISQNSYSSSLLNLTNSQLEGDWRSRNIGTEKVSIIDFNSYLENFDFTNKVALKLDVQGYEFKIIKTIEDKVHLFALIQLEVSLTELYKGETLYFQIDDFLRGKNFVLVSIEPGFYNNQTGQMLQSDFIYIKKI